MKQSLNDELQMKVEALLRVVDDEDKRNKKLFKSFEEQDSKLGAMCQMDSIRYNHVLKTLISDLERDVDELKEKEV
ncbi:hypothetical protein [Staphylococcus shinii]|uniref:hypothetical protein n=1 Tax=Staphylococcus shinii TaxID=2912228 RepID=UPI003D805DA7